MGVGWRWSTSWAGRRRALVKALAHRAAPGQGRGAGQGRGHQGAPSPPAPEQRQALHGLASSSDRAHRVKIVGAGHGRGHQVAPSPPAPEQRQALHGLATSSDRPHRVMALALAHRAAPGQGRGLVVGMATGTRATPGTARAGQQLRPGAPGRGRGRGLALVVGGPSSRIVATGTRAKPGTARTGHQLNNAPARRRGFGAKGKPSRAQFQQRARQAVKSWGQKERLERTKAQGKRGG